MPPAAPFAPPPIPQCSPPFQPQWGLRSAYSIIPNMASTLAFQYDVDLDILLYEMCKVANGASAHIHTLMLRLLFSLCVLSLMAVSCGSPPQNHGVQASSHDVQEEQVPLAVIRIDNIQVTSVGQILFDYRILDYVFKTTNCLDGAMLRISASFPLTSETKPKAILRLVSASRIKSYNLALGSQLCLNLANTLNVPPPADSSARSQGLHWRLAKQVATLQELLRGTYSYTSPPPP
jgi:hypothetical protein